MEQEKIGLDICKFEIAEHIFTALKIQDTNGHTLAELSVMNLYNNMEKPPESKLGDYAFPCFRFANLLRRKPQEIAGELAKSLAAANCRWLARSEAVGAFLNLYINQAELAKMLVPKILSGDYFSVYQNHPVNSQRRVMIEYSQPNTHKIFHVGHVRNVALGDSLRRLFEYCGYPVIPVNYIGDEGAHIAKCIWYIKKNDFTPPATGKGDWLGKMYTDATLMLEDALGEEKKQFEEEISGILREIEGKTGAIYDFWRESRQWSLDVFNEIYNWLEVRFDYVFTESEVSEESQAIVEEYFEKGIFIESDGAIGLDLKEHKCGFVLLRKRDGNTLYATKDLALARRKFEKFAIDTSVYVVASEQNLHFKQVFKTLELMGFDKAKNCHHLSYGMVVLPDGKMSSRAGNIVPFTELQHRLSEELDKNLAKYEEIWSADEIADTRHKLCVGAIKYGMLCSDVNRDIVFDMKNWLAFEGDTGPYLMYSYARTKSILRKAASLGFEPRIDALGLLGSPEEIELMRYLYDFNDVVFQACHGYRPSTLTHMLFDMCKVFNRFHSNVPVIKAETDALKGARLALIQAFSETLKAGLSLIGMTPPERM